MNDPLPPAFLVGLIGSGIQASRTPAMHEREGAEQGLRYVYKLIDLAALNLGPEALPELLTAAERMGYNGLNVTFPCKQAIIPLLHELSEDARALGAVNTVVLKDGQRIGHNTDSSGFWLFRPTVRRPRLTASSRPPTTSTLGRGPLSAMASRPGSAKCTATMATRTSGTLIQKMPRQPSAAASAAP